MSVDSQSSAETPAGSRRRHALMQQAQGSGERQGLSQADVVALAADRSIGGRVNLARKFGAEFDYLANGGTRDLAGAVLELLVKDVEQEVRKSLSEAIAHSLQLPPVAARRLAGDSIAVARPILEQSPVLSDEELVEIVRTNAMQYALAVAGRESLSPTVSDALVDTAEKSVVLRLVDNGSADISTAAFHRITQDFEGDSEMRGRMVQRPALPYELVDEMVGVIGERLQWQLINSRCIDPAEAQAIMDGVRQRASISLTAREHGRRNLKAHMSELHRAGDLSQEQILGFLKDGDIASFEAALAALADLDEPGVRRLAYNSDRRHLAALCIRAGIHTPHYVTLRMALDLADEAVSGGNGKRQYSADSMRFVQDQYERLRRDPDTVSVLMGEEPASAAA